MFNFYAKKLNFNKFLTNILHHITYSSHELLLLHLTLRIIRQNARTFFLALLKLLPEINLRWQDFIYT
jgi:hypothetical protein